MARVKCVFGVNIKCTAHSVDGLVFVACSALDSPNSKMVYASLSCQYLTCPALKTSKSHDPVADTLIVNHL